MKLELLVILSVYFGAVVFNSAVQANLDAIPTVDDVQNASILVDQVVILESIKLRTACLIGSLSGALLFFALNTDPMTPKQIASKTLASFVGGVVVSPVVIHMSRSPLTIDYIIAISGTVAFMFVFMVHKLRPHLAKFLLAKLGINVKSEVGK